MSAEGTPYKVHDSGHGGASVERGASSPGAAECRGGAHVPASSTAELQASEASGGFATDPHT